ncbi:glycosyltransferase family 2 protein [Marisediminicola sp. LYQ85]|uniref:glycosyltransferase family 2 protein n=1 Tax=Marisediminicola sp. LYQ85 TaxID=3391062 RepID=UPI003983D5F3
MDETVADLTSCAIVVVNYGSHVLVDENIAAVSLASPEATVVVVDNFTDDAERDAVLTMCDRRGWIPVPLDTNTGFGDGVNAGVAEALARGLTTIVVINPDATIARPDLERLVSAVASDDLLMVAPVILRSSGQHWFSGATVSLRDGTMSSRRRQPFAAPGAHHDWLTGACFVMSARLWAAVGGFDSDYFLYWEDVDLSVRVVEAGGHLLVDDRSVAVHDAGGTHTETLRGRAKSETYYYYNIRNRLVFAAKHITDDALAGWLASTLRVSYEILLQGGRRQFLRPVVPLRALIRGIRDGRRFVRETRGAG